MIDEGVDYNHEDLQANMWRNSGEIAGNGVDDDGNGFIDDVYGYDFYSFDGDPMDEGGHGTHVAGTICADANNGIGIAGVVQQCKIMALRFLGPQGGYTSGGIASLDYAVQMGATIANNSWGGGGFSQALYDAIAAARDGDHIFLAAAGNGDRLGNSIDNDVTPHYPSSYTLPNVVSVAATDNRDSLASFSNYGAVSVDIGAPGVDIASTYLNNGYVWMSGTSMATPNATGVVALIRSQNPGWNYQQVIDHLYTTARPAASMAGITTTGAIANAEAAVAGGEPQPLPNSPTGLIAVALSDSEIELSWTDTSDNESAFEIERDGQILAGTAPAEATTYNDTGLAASTEYTYRVRARNSTGPSEFWTGPAAATTDTPPPYQAVFASSESTLAGSVISGSLADTQAIDSAVEIIAEQESGGRLSLRHSYMDHRWSLSVPVGLVSLEITGWADSSGDGDTFNIDYSTGGAFNPVCSLSVGSASACSASFALAAATTVTVRVTDSDQSSGASNLDRVHIDQIVARADTSGGTIDPPAAPSALAATVSPGVISLTWVDNASNEASFEVRRSIDAGATWSTIASLGADTDSFDDGTVASQTQYTYQVFAVNTGGSAGSNTVVVESAEVATPTISLTATGYKEKGWQNVDLNWEGAAGSVTVYRDNTDVYSGALTSITDANIAKGGAVYDYQVCPGSEQPGSDTCSNVVTVVF